MTQLCVLCRLGTFLFDAKFEYNPLTLLYPISFWTLDSIYGRFSHQAGII